MPNWLKFNFRANEVPPDKYRYTCPDGFVVEGWHPDQWLLDIKKHYRDNNIPIPDDLSEQAEDQLCRLLPPGLCRYQDGSTLDTYIDVRLTQDDWIRGMGALLNIVTTRDALVDQETAEARGRICASCPANILIKGCGACIGIADAILKIRGAASTKADGKLMQCANCGCSNKAQVWVKTELLAKTVSEDQLRKFDLLSHCWKGKEIRELQSAQQPA